ncbi:MAG: ABC transporter substrate-binding protein [Chloroflexi bacterium]|nr:ABC transporter substrate-binding protein [Chloroflexota bacterium]
MIRVRARILVLGLLLVLLASCSPARSITTTTTTTTPSRTGTTAATTTSAAPSGPYGTLRMAVSGFETERFDPTVVATGTVSTLLVEIFDYFVGIKAPNPAPSIAESWEMAPDALSWVFRIRKDVKFHNGDQLTAKDVKYSLDRYSSDQAFYSYLRNAIKSVDIIDDFTVRVNTKGPQPQLLVSLGAESASAYALIMPASYIEKNGLPYFEQHPIGTGPFKFVSHAPADAIEYEANTSYWGQVPAYKKLMVVQMPEEATRVAAMKTGALDVIDVSMDSAISLERSGFKTTTMSYMPIGFQFYHVFQPPAAGKPTADIRVRQALSYAVNREEIMRTLFNSKAQPGFAPHLGEKSMYIDSARWAKYVSELFRFDLDKSKQLLKEAGYSNGFNVKLYSFSMAGGPFLPQLNQVLQGYWNAIGVKAEIVPSDWGSFSASRWIGSGKTRTPNPDLVGAISAMRNQERADPIQSLSHATDSNGSWSAFGTSKPDVDKLMASARGALSDKERGQFVDEVVKIEIDSFVWIPIARVPQLAVLGPGVDIQFPPMASVISQYAAIAKHR